MPATSTYTFEIIHQSTRSRARVGRLHTPHGTIDTPNFVAVGTNAAIKALDPVTVDALGLQLLFCNTYHLMVQPGTHIIKQAGGLHPFMNRKLPLITDSGGFQVFSLAYGGVANELKSKGLKKQDGMVIKITEEGVLFRSYRDGSPLLLTPETSIHAQKELGADIIIPFDELPPYHIDPEALRASFDRTHRWEERSLIAHLQNPQAQQLFAVIHGGIDPILRKKSCEILSRLPFDGFAIGGSVGKDKEEMHTLLENTVPHIPEDKPIHLLGIGDLPSLTRSIPLGIDTFDSSYPTRAARHGILLTDRGPLNITQGIHQTDFTPPDPVCTCPTCTHYTKAYLNHLFKAHETSAHTLATIHNLHYMVTYMNRMRSMICNNVI